MRAESSTGTSSTTRPDGVTAPPPGQEARRPKRADARRNYDRLVATARTAFLQGGTDVPLEDIARSAGVGIGTLYRHFPTRHELLEAVFLDEVESLQARAETLLQAPDAGAALEDWLHCLVEYSRCFRGLSASLLLTEDGRGTKASCHGILMEAAERLLTRAQRSGAFRSDVRAYDMVKLAHGVAVATERTSEPDTGRIIGIMIDGLRA